MAVVKYSALLDELRGKINGTVFSKFHDGYNSYKKGQPSRWGTASQQRQRIAFGQAPYIWKTMSQTNKDNIAAKAVLYPQKNRFGEDVFLSPWHYAMMLFRLRQISKVNPAASVTAADIILSRLTVDTSSVNITLGSDGVYYIDGILGLKRDNVATGSTSVSFYLSSAVSSNDLTPRRTHFFVTRIAVSAGSIGSSVSIAIPSTPLPSSFTPSTGDQLELKMIFWHSGNGIVLGNRPTFRLPFTFVPPAPPEWPITWSFSGNDGRFTELQNAGGTWQPQGTGTWLASPSENLAGIAADYEFELAMSPNLFSSDIARPEEFDDPRPTLSGTLAAKSSFAPYYITPAAIGDLQAWMRSNFSYTSGDGYKYQPTAIRIKNPTSGAWSNWGYSNIWLPIF